MDIEKLKTQKPEELRSIELAKGSKIPCFYHESRGKGYKKGCKDCYEKNLLQEDNGDWIHDIDMEDQ